MLRKKMKLLSVNAKGNHSGFPSIHWIDFPGKYYQLNHKLSIPPQYSILQKLPFHNFLVCDCRNLFIQGYKKH